jgi:hypothetical protein
MYLLGVRKKWVQALKNQMAHPQLRAIAPVAVASMPKSRSIKGMATPIMKKSNPSRAIKPAENSHSNHMGRVMGEASSFASKHWGD